MINYAIRRLLLAVPTLLGITLITFLIIQLAPGDPAQFQSSQIMDQEVSERVYEDLREYYGLDDPILVQYGRWLSRLVRLDFGNSWTPDGRPVIDKISERLWPTMSLAIIAISSGLLLSVPIGVYSAWKRDGTFDTVVSSILYALYSIPSYVMAVPLILYVGVRWDWLPFQGMKSDNYAELSSLGKAVDLLQHYPLIAFCFSFGAWAYYSRFVRQNMLEVLKQDYIRTAMAKGQKNSKVIWRHGFRNSMIPLVTLLGLMLPDLIGGSVILEVMFNWPGIGRLFFESIIARDYPTVMALSFISASLVLLGTLVSDLLYAVVDPRISYE